MSNLDEFVFVYGTEVGSVAVTGEDVDTELPADGHTVLELSDGTVIAVDHGDGGWSFDIDAYGHGTDAIVTDNPLFHEEGHIPDVGTVAVVEPVGQTITGATVVKNG